MIMSLTQYDLRRKIFRCAAQSECSVHHNLCKPEVSDLQVPVRSYKHVLWLQVPVSYLFTVEILQCENYLRGVKQCNIIWEETLSPQQSKYLTSLHILKA